MGVDVRGNDRAIRGLLAVRGDIDLEDSGETDLHLDASVLVKHVVEDIFWIAIRITRCSVLKVGSP
jgi:hypothetical protein